jgi:cobalt-precorrin 5A hydrolase/precorrin-3B C17-methyltransferase
VRYGKATTHIAALFRSGRPVIGVCAAGILIRAVAPELGDKEREPPVLAVAEDGSAVVPLLGGHRGANELAGRIATTLGISPAVTTAGELRLGIALDSPPPGWTLAHDADPKPFMSALLDGERARLTLEAPAPWLEGAIETEADADLELLVTPRPVPCTTDRLVYHPAVLAIGVGCERGAAADELWDLVLTTLDHARLSAQAVAAVVSIELKMAEPALAATAARLGVPLRFFAAEELEAESGRVPNPSEYVRAATGTPSVAEASALRAAGPAGVLVAPKRKSERCTCAIARAPAVIDVARVGRARGRVSVVGIGPGDPGSRTVNAADRLRTADEIVGYRLYLDHVEDLTRDKPVRAFPLGAEIERCRYALDRAAGGRDVALVCSGDPGIFAMASLVVELAGSREAPGWDGVEIDVVPGVSAFQAAAAKVGAAVGHDFCCISLSDLLTPMSVIEQRLAAAAAGDFVVALYNPVSQRRRTALGRAREILLAHRPGETPVVLARDLGRTGESVRIVTLRELDSDLVDMLTVVLVGARASRLVPRPDGRNHVLTPRGYPVR